MSTAGSSPEPAVSPAGETPPRPRRRGVIRWRGLIPLALILALITIGYILFADPIARATTSEAATELLGTQVDIAAMHILERETALDVQGLAIADPFDPMRNLVEARGIRVELERDPLLERKFVVRRLSISGVRLGTRRTNAAKPVPGGGYAPTLVRAMREWREQFDVPLLRLTPLDTIRDIVLDPTQLATVQRALQLRARADTVRSSIQTGYEQLRLRETLDSARAVVERLRGASPRSLGLAGTRQAVSDVRRTIAEINAAKERVQALERNARAGLDTLAAGVRAIDDARRADYAFARGLLKLPTFDAPEIGNAVFGPVSIDRFQDAVYWAELAERYLPPGLQPRRMSGPQRLRASGTTVQFVAPREYPTFLLRRGNADFALAGSVLASGDYALEVSNLSSAPALVGAPVRFELRRSGGSSGVTARLGGMMDRRGARSRDSVALLASGVPIPSFDVPALPFRVDPGTGLTSLTVLRVGDQYAGRWLLRADRVSWTLDSAKARSANYVESLIYRVIGGLTRLELEASLSGTVGAPRISVRSNVERAIADQLRTVLGEEIARAEARVRAEVDRIVRERAEPVKAHVAQLRSDAETRIDDARQRLEEQRRQLEQQLESLTGGILTLPRIPGTRP